MTVTATMSSTVERDVLEKQVHRLKLEWIMAKSDAERARVSQEIRRLTGPRKAA